MRRENLWHNLLMLREKTMDPVAKALWYIESHFSGEIPLAQIAEASGVSQYHLCRAFGEATGHSVMRYVRGRRLTEAAKALAKGAPDILSVALDAGYNSHEAFTRAFRDQFGITPEAVRAQSHLEKLQLIEAMRRDPTFMITLEPRIEQGRLLLIAGLSERLTPETRQRIPFQWQRFVPYIGHIPGEVPGVTYGVIADADDDGNIDYVTGAEVKSFENIPKELRCVRIPEQKYAVFTHTGHISTIRNTWDAILSSWMPQQRNVVVDAPEFERYDNRFDPQTGNGLVEIWIPIK